MVKLNAAMDTASFGFYRLRVGQMRKVTAKTAQARPYNGRRVVILEVPTPEEPRAKVRFLDTGRLGRIGPQDLSIVLESPTRPRLGRN